MFWLCCVKVALLQISAVDLFRMTRVLDDRPCFVLDRLLRKKKRDVLVLLFFLFCCLLCGFFLLAKSALTTDLNLDDCRLGVFMLSCFTAIMDCPYPSRGKKQKQFHTMTQRKRTNVRSSNHHARLLRMAAMKVFLYDCSTMLPFLSDALNCAVNGAPVLPRQGYIPNDDSYAKFPSACAVHRH